MVTLFVYLLRKLCRLHLRLDDLESDNVSGRPAAIVSLSAVADGETAFSERRASRIVDARRLGDNWRRRLSVNGRHGDCRWPWMHKCCACRACLRWTISTTKDGRLSLRLHTLGRRCHGRRLRLRKARVAFRLLHPSHSSIQSTASSSLRLRPARMKMTYIRAHAVIARKLPYCCCYIITVIRSNVLNVDHNGLPRP